MLLIIILWFGISAPLSAVGAYFGWKHGVSILFKCETSPLNCAKPATHPVRVNPIPRQIPPTPKYLRPWTAALLSGILPFGAKASFCLEDSALLTPRFLGAAFVEMYFVLSSLFASRAYYAFGFLALTAGVVALTTATVTILFTYFILCAEEYRCGFHFF
jgi:transmembrane 9 superfamily protein 2/4